MSNLEVTHWFELDASSYLPLPFFPYEARPKNLPLHVEEAATALFLSRGDLNHAAARLKVTPDRLQRVVRGSVRLTRLVARLLTANAVPESDDESKPDTSSQSARAPAPTGGSRP